MSLTHHAQPSADRSVGRGRPRPVLAIAAFIAPFAIYDVMARFDVDNFLVVVATVSFVGASVLLCVQLLGGNIISLKWFLAAGLCLSVYAGWHWYAIASLFAGMLLWLFLMDRYVGDFAPVFCPSDRNHRVFPRS